MVVKLNLDQPSERALGGLGLGLPRAFPWQPRASTGRARARAGVAFVGEMMS